MGARVSRVVLKRLLLMRKLATSASWPLATRNSPLACHMHNATRKVRSQDPAQDWMGPMTRRDRV